MLRALKTKSRMLCTTALQQQSDEATSALELRSKRFAGFMHALHDISLLLEQQE